jgi:hypothetical protein
MDFIISEIRNMYITNTVSKMIDTMTMTDKEKEKIERKINDKIKLDTEGWPELDCELSKMLQESKSIDDFHTFERRLKTIPLSIHMDKFMYKPKQIVRCKESHVNTITDFKIVDDYLICDINETSFDSSCQSVTLIAPTGIIIVAIESKLKTFINTENNNKITVDFSLDDFIVNPGNLLRHGLTVVLKCRGIQLAIKYDFIYFPKSWYVIFADGLLTILKEYQIKCVRKPARKYDMYYVKSGIGTPSNKLRSMIIDGQLDPWYQVSPQISYSEVFENIFNEEVADDMDSDSDDEFLHHDSTAGILNRFKKDIMKSAIKTIEDVICD